MTQRVDDANLSRLIYANGGQGWKRNSPSDPAENNGTSHGSSDPGASVTFLFNGFEPGTSVQLRGTIHPQKQTDPSAQTQKPLAIFTLDFTTKEIFQGNPTNDTQYNQPFFDSVLLPAAQHSLTMTLVDPDNLLWFDYIDYEPVTLADLPPTSTMSTPATVTITSQSDTKNAVSKGLVAGIAILAAVLASVIVVGFLWWLRQRRRRQDHKQVSLTGSPNRTNVALSDRESSQYQVEPYTASTSLASSAGSGSGKEKYTNDQKRSSYNSGPNTGPSQPPQGGFAPLRLQDLGPPLYSK
ncbi:hypothetical protein V5O48_018323 [Marasmius crinis-equi]|uniref:Uncharacterized protein n=1 Tax=Marasmius crinis-equi TaxID=585013 RepID=A0ABR3ELH5_9AGAR